MNLVELRERGFGDIANAMEAGLYIREDLLRALGQGDYETAHRIRIQMVTQECAEFILDGVWERWRIDGDRNGPWTWLIVDQKDFLESFDIGDFYQSLSEDDQEYFHREVEEKVAVMTAEALAEDPYLRGEDGDAPDPSVVAEVLSAIPQYRERVSTDERRERITAAAKTAAQVMPTPQTT